MLRPTEHVFMSTRNDDLRMSGEGRSVFIFLCDHLYVFLRCGDLWILAHRRRRRRNRGKERGGGGRKENKEKRREQGGGSRKRRRGSGKEGVVYDVIF